MGAIELHRPTWAMGALVPCGHLLHTRLGHPLKRLREGWATMRWGTVQEDAAFQTGWAHVGYLPRETLELLLGKLRENAKVAGES